MSPKLNGPTASAKELISRKIATWFHQRGWDILPHQKEAWDAIDSKESGLVVLPTGSGKTYAAFLGFLPLLSLDQSHLQLIYITPLKALTRDIEKSLHSALSALSLDFSLATRTGDSSPTQRKKQKSAFPQILVTTPESLALLLTYEDSSTRFTHLKGIIIDEWHDFLGSKRGSLLELNLSYLRSLAPEASIWGLTATIANPELAAKVLCGPNRSYRIIRSKTRRDIKINTILPKDPSDLPWAGRLGLKLAPTLAKKLSCDVATLIFTNTRSQAEQWHNALTLLKPEWEDKLAIHHGSLDAKIRAQIEQGIKDGSTRIVVCTASLDLGVDFPSIDRIVQIGSPKYIARLLQRAGRSAHNPEGKSELWFVPTHALELLELAAFRDALILGEIESRSPLSKPLDVLIQHIVSRALSGGISKLTLEKELSDTFSYSSINPEELAWVFRFVSDGGGLLSAYPQYCKLIEDDGNYRIKNRMIEILHRQNIGTISSESSLDLKLLRGKSIGTIDERFLSKLKKGESFLYGGRWLELVRIEGMTATVKPTRRNKSGSVAVWTGSHLPWSPQLGYSMRRVLSEYCLSKSLPSFEEKTMLSALLSAQAQISGIPKVYEILLEISQSREGKHFFLYPFLGKGFHEGLAALITFRLSRLFNASFSCSANDYGIEVVTSKSIPDHLNWHELLTPTNALSDMEQAINTAEIAKRHFRNIARIAGLVFPNLKGQKKTGRQIQTSSSLLYDVFRQFDSSNLLLEQAKNEALAAVVYDQNLEERLKALSETSILSHHTRIFSPFAFPLYLERVSTLITSEDLQSRIAKMQLQWQKSAQRSK